MDELELNFVPLQNQNQTLSIYRKPVPDSSLMKDENDYRAILPKSIEREDSISIEKEDWIHFDVSLFRKEGYEHFDYEFSMNRIFTVHLIYQELIRKLNNGESGAEHHLPEKPIARKEVHFIYKKHDEGTSDVVVKPYYLKRKRLFGFLLEHKLRLKENQPFNKKTQILSFSLNQSGMANIFYYRDKRTELLTFMKSVLAPILTGTLLEIESKFTLLGTEKLGVKSYLVGENHTAQSQFMGIKDNGPYRQINDKVRYLFLFSHQTKSLATDIYLGLLGKLFPGQFPGLKKMFWLPIHKEIVEHVVVESFDKLSIDRVKADIDKIKKSFPQDKLIVVAVFPKGIKGVDSAFDAYSYLKLVALEKRIYCQVVTEDSFYKKDQLKWSISNIGLQIFSKLGGAPWLVKPVKTNRIIFGIGSVQERSNGQIKKYSAYTICLDSSGDYKFIKPLFSSRDEVEYLTGFKSELQAILLSELGANYQSLLLHLPYKISREEINAVKSVVSSIREDNNIEVIVVRINTKHQFLGFSDHNTCVPHESTYVRLSSNEFLVWAEGLQYGKEVLHKRVSEPLYINFIECKDSWDTKKECLQEILNLTGANWRGFNSKAQPISILYSRLIARFMKDFSHLDAAYDKSLLYVKSDAPWFL